MTRTRTILRGALLATASLLVAPSAFAAPTWIGPNDLSAPGQAALSARIVVAPGGEATAIWSRFNGAHLVIQSATRGSGAPAFSAPVDLSDPTVDAREPRLAIDPQGDVTAVWQQTGIHATITAATRTAGAGSFSAPMVVSSPATDAYSPQVAADGRGIVTVVWTTAQSTSAYVVEAASRAAGAPSFSAPVPLSAVGVANPLPQLATDPAGDATAVWAQDDAHLGTPHTTIQAARRPAAAAAFTGAIDVSAAGLESYDPRVAVDGQGTATAVWTRVGFAPTVIQSSTWPLPSPSASPLVDLSAGATSADSPAVAVDARGDVAVVWRQADTGGTSIVGAAVRTAGAGAFEPPAPVSIAGGGIDALGLSSGANGGIGVIWSRGNGTEHAIQAAILSPGSASFAPALAVSSAAQPALEPTLGLDDQGNALAVWSRSDGTNEIVQSSLLDAVGPLLSGLVVPTVPIAAGSSGAFSVVADDRWSPVSSVAWDFGDGATATGASVTHAYVSAGSKSVKVTATDAVGNASTATTTVKVVAGFGRTRPRISSAFLFLPRLRAFGRGALFLRPTNANRRVGTTLAITTSEPGRLEIAVQRAQVGRRRGTRCVAGRTVGVPCVVLRTLGTRYTRQIPRGDTTLRFTGRLDARRLTPGSYRLALTVTDAAGNRSAGARIVFRVLA